jgi:hypothetical protein
MDAPHEPIELGAASSVDEDATHDADGVADLEGVGAQAGASFEERINLVGSEVPDELEVEAHGSDDDGDDLGERDELGDELAPDDIPAMTLLADPDGEALEGDEEGKDRAEGKASGGSSDEPAAE